MGKGISKRAKKQIFNILFLLVLIGVTLFILFRSNRELNFSDIGKFIKSSNPWLLAAAFVCMLLFIVFEGLSIHLISKRLGYKNRLLSSMVGGYLLFRDHALGVGRPARVRLLYGQGRNRSRGDHVYPRIQSHRLYGGDPRHRRGGVYHTPAHVFAVRVLDKVSRGGGAYRAEPSAGVFYRLHALSQGGAGVRKRAYFLSA